MIELSIERGCVTGSSSSVSGPFAENDRVYNLIEIARSSIVWLHARRNARFGGDRFVDDEHVRADLSDGDGLAFTAAWHR